MATELDICNSALAKLGSKAITSLSSGSKRAKLCNQQYTKVRDQLLRQHPWNFAVARIKLSENGNTPAFGFNHEFDVPSNFLRVLRIDPTYLTFKVEGDKILADDDEISLVYIKKITNPSKYDENFTELLATLLASDIAYSLVQSVSLSDRLKLEAEELMRKVRSLDAQEGTPHELEADLFTNVRR